jgi:hypothetical protein
MKHLRLFALLLIPCVAIGCGSGNSQVPGSLSGKITYKGQPLKGGMLKFFASADSTGYDGIISPSGNYNATDIPIGDLIVTVDTEHLKAAGKPKGKDADKYTKMGGQAPPPGITPVKSEDLYTEIPKKYNSTKTSPLKVTVSKGKSTKDIELTD